MRLLDSMQTGGSAFEKVYGKPIFDSFSAHPETGKPFDRPMNGVRGRGTGAMLEPYDFTGLRMLAGIGGGSVIRAILRRYGQTSAADARMLMARVVRPCGSVTRPSPGSGRRTSSSLAPHVKCQGRITNQ
jgi:hypothetical protein